MVRILPKLASGEPCRGLTRSEGARVRRWHWRRSKAGSRVAEAEQSPLFFVAHAGLASHLPGRIPTKQTIDKAVRLRADMIELDVCVTRDGAIVVAHDPWTPSKRHIRSLTLSELMAEWPQIITLDRCVSWVNNRTSLMLDLKTDYGDTDAVDTIARWLNAHPLARASVCAKDPEALQRLRDTAPQAPRWQTLPQVEGRPFQIARQVMYVLWRQRKRIGWRYFRMAAVDAVRDLPSQHRLRLTKVNVMPWLGIEDDLPRLAAATGASGFTVEHFLATPEVCRAAQNLGLPVVAWVVNDSTTAARVVNAGVSGITTDNLGPVKAAAQRQIAAIEAAAPRQLGSGELPGLAA
jgi:glycerophosphoryl diester phosphodiesterase